MIDVSGIASGIAALAELVIRGLLLLVERTFCLIAYACSKTYREEKNAGWKNRQLKKVLSLGFSGLCLFSLIYIAVWGVMQFKRNKLADSYARQTQPEFRWQMQATDKDNIPLKVTIKEGSASNLMAAHGLADLAKKIKENLVVGGKTNHLTNVTVKFKFEAGASQK